MKQHTSDLLKSAVINIPALSELTLSSEPTNINTLNGGEVISLPIQAIQCFWQKIVSLEPRRLVTQIIYDENNDCKPTKVETLLSLDEVRDLIVAAGHKHFLTLHRAYTRDDNRVIIKYVSTFAATAARAACILSRTCFENVQRRRKQASHDCACGSLLDDHHDLRIGFEDYGMFLIVDDLENIAAAIAELDMSLFGHP